MKYFKLILFKYSFLLPYLLMATSFLSVILPYLGIPFDGNFWFNAGGYSLITNLMFVYALSFNKRNCFPTRSLPFALCIVSIFNIIMSFFPKYYDEYSIAFEILVFSITLAIWFILGLSILLKRIYGNYITH